MPVSHRQARACKPSAHHDSSSLLAIYDGQAIRGHVRLHGPAVGFEAYDADGRSLGIYQSLRAAMAAVPAASDQEVRS
jgi:hypothetical protein